MSQDILRQLRERIDQYSVGMTASAAGSEMVVLERLFTPEEARPFLAGGRPDSRTSGSAPLDWTRLRDTARREGVAALLFRNIREHRLEALIPEPIHRDLSDQYRRNLRRNMAIIGILRRVLSGFRE